MNLPGPNAEFETTLLAVAIANAPSSQRGNDAHEPATKTMPTTANTLLQDKSNRPGCNAKVNIKYKNETGRAAVLAVSRTVHYDDSQVSNICNVTLPVENLSVLAEDPDIEWVDRSGAVFFL